MRTPEKMLALAIAIASEAFKFTVDKGGQPYILHCFRVMMKISKTDFERRIIAILHDLIEDTDENSPINWTLTMLKDMGFSNRVTDALALLTHDLSVDYMDYIYALAGNEDARAVKMADLEDNSNILRMKDVREKDFARIGKYFKAYHYLKNYK